MKASKVTILPYTKLWHKSTALFIVVCSWHTTQHHNGIPQNSTIESAHILSGTWPWCGLKSTCYIITSIIGSWRHNTVHHLMLSPDNNRIRVISRTFSVLIFISCVTDIHTSFYGIIPKQGLYGDTTNAAFRAGSIYRKLQMRCCRHTSGNSVYCVSHVQQNIYSNSIL